MKKTLFTLLTAIVFINLSMAQNFSGLVRKQDYPKIQRILSNPTDPIYQNWLNSRTQRDSVIIFCDKTIEEIFDIKNNKFQFRHVFEKTKEALDGTEQSAYSLTYQRLFAGTKIDKDSVNSNIDIDNIVFQEAADDLIYDYVKTLMTFLMIDSYQMDENMIKMSMAQMRSQESIEILLNYYDKFIDTENYEKMPEEMQIRNMKIISSRLSTIQSKNYVFYQSPYAQNKKIKSIEFYLDNDVFLFGTNINQDREYTGGGAISFTTDYLKWRWFNTRWVNERLFKKKYSDKKILQTRRVLLSYQSIKLGMQFYTPYIRYRNNFQLADTLYKLDRPFGSYVYLERSKFRIWSKGLARSESNLQVGKIGTSLGGNIQATLHQDATVTSQKVYGWDQQVNNGGRWTIQVNHKIDFLLFSNTNKYVSVLSNWFTNNISLNTKQPAYCKRLNIYSTWESFLGTYYTAFGTGLYVSAADFKNQSGQNFLMPRKRNSKEFGFNWELGIKYRRVVHNSMLEGIGFTKSFDDDKYDNENLSAYTIPRDKIIHDLFLLDFKLAFRWRKMVIYYSNTYLSKEYDLDIKNYNYSNLADFASTEDKKFYSDKVISELQEFNKKKLYGFGRIGINWLIE